MQRLKNENRLNNFFFFHKVVFTQTFISLSLPALSSTAGQQQVLRANQRKRVGNVIIELPYIHERHHPINSHQQTFPCRQVNHFSLKTICMGLRNKFMDIADIMRIAFNYHSGNKVLRRFTNVPQW